MRSKIKKNPEVREYTLQLATRKNVIQMSSDVISHY
jgi:tRNA U34 5-methylaminomethyl-2-thiouridine-forming methyltransferase MnmC